MYVQQCFKKKMQSNEALENTGNSCYSNVCLVVLRYLKPFTDLLLENTWDTTSIKNIRMYDTLKTLMYTDTSSEDLNKFNKMIQDKYGYQQQDSFDCLQYITDQLSTEYDQLFELAIEKHIRCDACSRTKRVEDKCVFLPLESSTQSLLQQFNNKQYPVDLTCDHCTSTKATINESIKSLPTILTYTRPKYIQDKVLINHIPFDLCLCDTNDKLQSVVCHIGNIYGGHYVVFVTHDENNIICYNDNIAKTISKEEFQKCASKYCSIIFYVS